jgi:hypothetical protein
VAAGEEAALVFAADKVSKLREWRVRMARGEEIPAETMMHYRESAEAVAATIPEHPLTDLLRFELEALGAYPPAPGDRDAPPAAATRAP